MAEFIGCDGSMGLRHGEYYDIAIKKDSRYIWVRWKPKTFLESALRVFEASQVLGTKPYNCAYSNEEKFCENWRVLPSTWSVFE